MATRLFNQYGSDQLVPSVVSDKISEVVKRTKGTRLLSAAIVAFAAALAIVLIAIGVDGVLVLFETEQRTQLTRMALIAMGTLTIASFGMAVLRRISKLEAAHQIDEQIPELQERWASVTEFSSTQTAPQMRGSETFIRKVAEEAAQLEHIVVPRQINQGNGFRLAAAGLLAVAAMWIVAFAVDPGRMSVLVRRFLSPQSNISLTRIDAASGDVIQPRGSKFRLEAIVSGRSQSRTQLTIQQQGQSDQIVLLEALNSDPNRFVFPIKELQEPFTYRFRSGDGQTSWHTVKLADRPALKVVDFTITPPAYSKLPEFHQDGLPKTIKALQGSRLVLRIEPNIPLKSLVLQNEDKTEMALNANESNSYLWETTLNSTIAFRPLMLSEEGLTNSQPPRCEITVFRDQAPTVEVANPTNEIALRPDDQVTISFDAKDDLGISKAELVIFDPTKEGNVELKTIPIPLGDQSGEKTVHSQAEIDLKQFELKHGEQLTYAIRVYDTLEKAATQQPASSPESKLQHAKVDLPASEQTQQQANAKSQQTSNQEKPGSTSIRSEE